MDYPYEALNPEAFQQFVQALLVKEYPGVQCFPVGQPDGGRDATAYLESADEKDFLVYQVKFRREPGLADARDWLKAVMATEAPKIQDLIPKGARRYVLITNIAGTAHPEAGSIDTVQRLLDSLSPLPTMCWWRDDLSRRLDAEWDLKWTYPQLMTGVDLIRALIEGRLDRDHERRARTLRAFLRDQCIRDSEVRFKQIELQNRLLDLFLDVPVSLPERAVPRKKQYHNRFLIYSVAREQAERSAGGPHADAENAAHLNTERPRVGAATLLLHPTIHPRLSKVVLEGAPGQGKSTITQYLCQVHRMKLLSEADLARVPDAHRHAPMRLPFKVDLRDLAAWLAKRDPFAADHTDSAPVGWHKSLEAFLAAQVRHYSGGNSFDVDDLHAVASLCPLLIVLDGLDEVAESSRRQEVVDEIQRGVHRLSSVASSVQAVVTSRPAAFANSPGMTEQTFCYLQLESVTRSLIETYTTKWLEARKVHGREASDVRRIIREKLHQPHLRDLARNPMQLAILLSLVHTQGASLPDKRTELYDSYIRLFFNREAEKSSVVRDNRQLIVDIHRFVAWTLHKEAERGADSGRIATDRLERLVATYLADEGQDTSLAETLFKSGVERVGALVSRLQGTLEFEVQPLREYFAARFLYETAQYSPTGSPRAGTLPDRFDALIRNFYWLNVARFYAGCFSKGELPSLVDRLQELIRNSAFESTSHPRTLSAMLLSDWVFTQHARSMREVVSIVTDSIGLRQVAAVSDLRGAEDRSFVLPPQAGRDALIDRCFDLLATQPALDYARGLIDLVRSNGSPRVRERWIREMNSTDPEKRSHWFEVGLYLGLLPKLSTEEILDYLTDSATVDVRRLAALFHARRFDCIESSPVLCEAALSQVLDRSIEVFRPGRKRAPLEDIGVALNATRYAEAFGMPRPVPLREALRHRQHIAATDDSYSSGTLMAVRSDWRQVVDVAERQLDRPCGEWATSVGPWESIVEAARSTFGTRWALCHMANVSSSIRSSTETCTDAPDLFDEGVSLCRRVRYARLRAGNANWWRRQFEGARNGQERALGTLVLASWGAHQTLRQCIEVMDAACAKLTEAEWIMVIDSLHDLPEHGRTRDGQLSMEDLPETLNARTAALLASRFHPSDQSDFCARYISEYGGSDRYVRDLQLGVALNEAQRASRSSDWDSILRRIRLAYLGANVTRRSLAIEWHYYRGLALSEKAAFEVGRNADKYPSFLVMAAEKVCREFVAKRIEPVGLVAERDNWFS